MRKILIPAIILVASMGGTMAAQDNTSSNTQQPAYGCVAPAMGCGYENYYNCDQPTLVNRYAELASKYKNLGPNDRWSAIYNGNKEVQELQQLDNYYAQNANPKGLNSDQLLQLRAAQGSVQR